MRPDILNPLFAEVEVLKGIGPTLARPLHRLGLNRVVDILFHLPVSWIDRKKVSALDEATTVGGLRAEGGWLYIMQLGVDPARAGGHRVFRLEEWSPAIICSEAMKVTLEREGWTGLVFREVASPAPA